MYGECMAAADSLSTWIIRLPYSRALETGSQKIQVTCSSLSHCPIRSLKVGGMTTSIFGLIR